MEKSWGSVSKALYSQRLSVLTSLRIAHQVASALHFLHSKRIHHGAVNIQNVVLSKHPDDPRTENSTAKITNFTRAELGVDDHRVLRIDIRAYGVFTSNLFVETISDVVRFDEGTLQDEDEIERIRANLNAIRTDNPELEALLLRLLMLEFPTASIIDESFFELHDLLKFSIRQKHAQRLVPQPQHQPPGQPPHLADVEVAGQKFRL
jgi:serine/threonine protein kinase